MTNPPDPCSAAAHVRRHWAVFLGLAIALAIWCGVDVARRAIVDPQNPDLHMTDFTVYTIAGEAFFDGREPYDVANLRGWRYLYPPLFALLVAPLAALDTYWQAVVWFAASALMAFGCYFECRRLVASCATSRGTTASDGPQIVRGDVTAWLFAAALGATLFPALNTLQRGQMGLSLLYPLLVGYRLASQGETRWTRFAGGVILALPIAFKLTPALPVGCLIATLFLDSLMRRDARSRFAPASIGLAAGCLLFFLVLPAGLIGWNSNLRHLKTWYDRVASHVNDVRQDDFGGDVTSPRNQSLDNAVYRCGNWVAREFFGGPDDLIMGASRPKMPMDAPVVARSLSALRFAGLLALAVCVLVAGRSGESRLHATVFGLACVATLVVSPVSRGHYFVFWVPAVLVAPLWLREAGRPRTALALAAIPALLTIAHYALLPQAGRMGLLGLGTGAWFFAACWQVWRTRPRGSSREQLIQSEPTSTLEPAQAA